MSLPNFYFEGGGKTLRAIWMLSQKTCRQSRQRARAGC